MIASESMTRADIKKRVALRVDQIEQSASTGKNEARATNPTDDLLDLAVRDGTDEFYRAHKWSFDSQFVEFTLAPAGDGPLNINADPTRILLPPYIESLPQTSVLFKGPGTNPGGRARVRHMDEVATRAYQDPISMGFPEAVGCEYNATLRAGLSERGGIELRVWPKPDQAYVLGFRSRIGAIPFVVDSQRGQWPQGHDATVVAFAVREFFRHDRNPEDAGQGRAIAQAQADVNEALETSVRIDNEDYRPGVMGAAGETNWPTGRLVKGYDTDGSLLVSVTVYD